MLQATCIVDATFDLYTLWTWFKASQISVGHSSGQRTMTYVLSIMKREPCMRRVAKGAEQPTVGYRIDLEWELDSVSQGSARA